MMRLRRTRGSELYNLTGDSQLFRLTVIPRDLVPPQEQTGDDEDRSRPRVPSPPVENGGLLPSRLPSIADGRTKGKLLPLA